MTTGYRLNKIKKFWGLQVPDIQAAPQPLDHRDSGGLELLQLISQALTAVRCRRTAGAQALKLSSLTSQQAWDILGVRKDKNLC
tara:strand:- start:2347 stop:2598 length:252 start_codon:yes stop_codon:yes gene_type:complete